MIYGSVYNESVGSSCLDGIEPYEFDESMSFMEIGAQIVEEATEDWNNYIQAVALTELSYVAENNKAYIYEAVDLKKMGETVVEWFKKMWAKIQGLIKSAIAKISSMTSNDAKFISTYKSAIEDGAKHIPDAFSYKGYTFEGIDNAKKIGDASYIEDEKEFSSSDAIAEKLSDYREQLAGSGNGDKAGFKKALKELFYGSADKENISTVNVSSLISEVADAKRDIATIKNAEAEEKRSIENKIRNIQYLKKQNKDVKEDTDDQTSASTFNNFAKYLQQVETINAQWLGVYVSAITARKRQSKAVCVKLISYSNKATAADKAKKSVGESASLLEDRFAALEF